MFCGERALVDSPHPERTQVFQVTTFPFHEKLLECCENRGDPWATEVQNRLHGFIDLVAAEAIYNSNCHSRFIPLKTLSTTPGNTIKGRPEDQEMRQWFEMLCNWLEASLPANRIASRNTDADLYTLSELHGKMTEFCGGSDVYTIKRLKQKWQDRYQDFVFFADVEERSNVVCFRNMAKYIISEK